MNKTGKILIAILAAVLYGLSAPAAKVLLRYINPLFMAALLYIGAGAGMLIYSLIKGLKNKEHSEAKLTRREMPYVIAMILLDIAAPILLLIGLKNTSAGTASLLNNFEIVATSLIALVFFKEAIGKRQWIALVLIIIASGILSFEGQGDFKISFSALYILLACICWGIENNCTRQLSLKDPVQIVIIKGFGSGIGALAVCMFWGEFTFNWIYIVCTLVLGFVAYGLSILCYVYAQRSLGAVRTSIYYSIAPFVGVLLSWLVLKESISFTFLAALCIMIIATYFMVTEIHSHQHRHQIAMHNHRHKHDDKHHDHIHGEDIKGYHSHEHIHDETEHSHSHYPDEHHRHEH